MGTVTPPERYRQIGMAQRSYRFLLRPKWIGFHLLVAAAMVAMVNLGMWQLRRLDERRTFNEQVISRSDQPIAPLDEVLAGGPPPDSLSYRRVTVTGQYTPEPTVQIVNRSQGGVAGRNLVNALRTEQGTVVLINRGFLDARVTAPPPPSGTVTVIGRLRTSEVRRTGQVADETGVQLTEARRIDLHVLAAQFGGRLAPVYVEALESQPADGALEAVAAPELSEGPHLNYAIQWFIFTVCVAAGWAFAVYRSANPTKRPRRGPPPIDEELSAELARQRAAEHPST